MANSSIIRTFTTATRSKTHPYISPLEIARLDTSILRDCYVKVTSGGDLKQSK